MHESIRRRYHLSAHTQIEWIDDGHSISIVPVAQDPISALRGKFRTANLSPALAKSRAEDRDRG